MPNTKELNTRIGLKFDTTANWNSNKNKVLLSGEVAFEKTSTGEIKMKVGDGVKTYEQLPYVARSNFDLDLSGKENTSNKVSAWQATPDNTHYPTEKLVKDSLDAVVHKTGNENIDGVKTFISRPAINMTTSNLPSAYQQVEYLASTGDQYINTRLVPTATMSYEATIAYVAEGFVLGARESNASKITSINFDATTPVPLNVRIGSNSNVLISTPNLTKENVYTVKISSGSSSIYNETIKTLLASGAASYGNNFANLPIYLFTVNNNGAPGSSNYSINRIYKFIVKDSGTPIRNFVPCYRKSDSVAGMYETVQGTFYTNNGTGSFNIGPATGVHSDVAALSDLEPKVDRSELAQVALTGSYNDLTNKPTIGNGTITIKDSDATHSSSFTLNQSGNTTITLAKAAWTGSYNDLTNKPTIPTVNNGKLTIQKNGTKVAEFTANSNSAVTANITVPTQASDVGAVSTTEFNTHVAAEVGQKYAGSTGGEIFNSYTTNIASGDYAHAEGVGTTASKRGAHAEGQGAIASGVTSHAEGAGTEAIGDQSHAEGINVNALGKASHAEGDAVTAIKNYSHAEGSFTVAAGENAHAEGLGEFYHSTRYPYFSITTENWVNDTTLNLGTTSRLSWSANDIGKIFSKTYTAIYLITNVAKDASNNVILTVRAIYGSERTTGNHFLSRGAIGDYSHTEGKLTHASNESAHAEGDSTIASGIVSHAEGKGSAAKGKYSHAEGNGTTASGDNSHAEGSSTTASNLSAHAEGRGCQATGIGAHAEGGATQASGGDSHAEGNSTKALGGYSHASGFNTIAKGTYSFACGKYNIQDNSSTYAFILGNGTADNARANALTVDWQGNLHVAGTITDSSNSVLENQGNKVTAITASSTDVQYPSAKAVYNAIQSNTLEWEDF